MTRKIFFVFACPALAVLTVLVAFTVLPHAYAQEESLREFRIHFLSLRSSRVFLRHGPGRRFPVLWVYHRPGLPVKILDSYDKWRRVRDPEGTTGWVHISLLEDLRTFFVKSPSIFLHRSPAPLAPLEAVLQYGVVGELLRCDFEWCHVRVKNYRGWILQEEVFGDVRPRLD